MTYDLSCDLCRVAPGSVQMLGSWCQKVDSLAWASLGSPGSDGSRHSSSPGGQPALSFGEQGRIGTGPWSCVHGIEFNPN